MKYIKFEDILKSNLRIYQKIINLFKYKKASDFRKERLILNYSKSLFIVSVKIIFILISIFVFMLILDLLSNSFLNLILSIQGIIELCVIFLIYHLIRKKFYAKL